MAHNLLSYNEARSSSFANSLGKEGEASMAFRALTIVASLFIQLLAAGCGGGGGGFSSLFGGDEGSEGFGSDGSNAFITSASSGFSASSGTDSSSSVATVHHPEPTSVVLFGSGLAGLTLWRHRRARRRSS